MFPAYAGMIRFLCYQAAIGGRVPRIRGDDPGKAYVVDEYALCSPHTRG